MIGRRRRSASFRFISPCVLILPFLAAPGGSINVGIEHTATPAPTATVTPPKLSTPEPTPRVPDGHSHAA